MDIARLGSFVNSDSQNNPVCCRLNHNLHGTISMKQQDSFLKRAISNSHQTRQSVDVISA